MARKNGSSAEKRNRTLDLVSHKDTKTDTKDHKEDNQYLSSLWSFVVLCAFVVKPDGEPRTAPGPPDRRVDGGRPRAGHGQVGARVGELHPVEEPEEPHQQACSRRGQAAADRIEVGRPRDQDDLEVRAT